MGRKGKTQKHTAKEINGKIKAAKEKNGLAGGGGTGLATRLEAMKKTSVVCELCKLAQPSLKTMQIHFENKHPKDAFPESSYARKFEEAKAAAQANQSAWK